MTTTESTTDKLIRALQMQHAPGWLIKRARNGMYDTSKSTLAWHNLCNDVATARLGTAFTQRCLDHEFDATEAEDKAAAEEWLESPEGQAALKKYTRPLGRIQ